VRQPDAGLELRRCGGERCGGREQRAVVGLRVCDCCGARAGQPGLQRGCARGPRVCERGRHDGRDGVRGVSMVVVEQRCLQGGRGRRGRGQARAGAGAGSGAGALAGRRCECGAAVRQPDAGLELRRCGGERCGGREQRAVVGLRVCDCCGARAGQPGLQRGCARGPRVCERGRHDGRDGVRGVSMVVVEQRCLQGGRGRRGRGQARAGASRGRGRGCPSL
jgi:hypothetical protein